MRARTNVRAQRADAVGPRPLELIVRLQFGHAPSVEIDGVRASSFSRRNLGALSDQVFLDQQLHRRAPNGASLSVPYFESGPIPRSVPPALGTLSTVLIGLICGIPLALVARRHTLASWVVFALTALASSAVLHWIRGPGLFSFADSWSIPESWLYLIGVLLFALPTAAIVNRRPKLQPNQRLERP